MRSVIKFYLDISARYPKLVNGTTGFSIAGLGDYLCQKYFEHPRKVESIILPASVHAEDVNSVNTVNTVNSTQNTFTHQTLPHPVGSIEQQLHTDPTIFAWDKKRTLDMCLIRAFIITPFVIKWYQVLPRISPGLHLRSVLTRVLLDQAIGSPTVISLVFVASAILKGDIHRLPSMFRNQFLDTWITGMGYWPFVHTFNFRFVPQQHQPLFAHVASVYWNAVLSYYSNKSTGMIEQDTSIVVESSTK